MMRISKPYRLRVRMGTIDLFFTYLRMHPAVGKISEPFTTNSPLI